MEKRYPRVRKDSSEELGKYLAKNGPALLPLVELIEPSQAAVDELIEVVGRATVEAVLSAAADRRKAWRGRPIRARKAAPSAGTDGSKGRSV